MIRREEEAYEAALDYGYDNVMPYPPKPRAPLAIRREVLPVLRRRLEAAAVAAGVFGLAFWTYALMW